MMMGMTMMMKTRKTVGRLELCIGLANNSLIGFLQYQRHDEEEDDGDPERAAAHARLDRQRLHEAEISGEELARRLKERYARNEQMVEDLGTVPQRMLMPSVNDPNLWQIKVKVRSALVLRQDHD